MTTAPRILRIHPDDHVGVAVADLAAGTEVEVAGRAIMVGVDVPVGHKIALVGRPPGSMVVKLGHPIGRAREAIAPGAWVHEHNLESTLGSAVVAEGPNGTDPLSLGDSVERPLAAAGAQTFGGYRRADGRVGTRNEIWILVTVGCVSRAAERIARAAAARVATMPGVDGVYAFAHPFGCSQLGDDLADTRAILAGLLRHPNAGGVLVLGLGCENNQLEALIERAELAGPVERRRLRYFAAQAVEDEFDAGLEAVEALAVVMAEDRRRPCALADLVIGLECGGSDAWSGLTANPLVGRVADRVCAAGGRAILSEVPEMFGAEHLLTARAADDSVARAIVEMSARFRKYFLDHGQPVSENPSPGNRAGGLTTLEEKSLGAVQKGGRTTVRQVLPYGGTIAPGAGLALLETPGNDAVSSTAMVAAGATVLLFTTGRGTPLGFPAPTLKVASNSALAERKPRWIDFDAGRILEGVEVDTLADDLLAQVVDVASGAPTRSEISGDREIAIWKRGVTL